MEITTVLQFKLFSFVFQFWNRFIMVVERPRRRHVSRIVCLTACNLVIERYKKGMQNIVLGRKLMEVSFVQTSLLTKRNG